MPTILCIDDNATCLATRKAVLESKGYCVLTAEDGITGLSLLRTSNGIDAVILDYQMPGMDGESVAGIIRSEQADLPIVLLSGFRQELLESPVLAVVDAVITKGERPEVLLAVLERLTGTKPDRPRAKISSEESRKLRQQAKAIRSELRAMRASPGERWKFGPSQ